VISEADARYFAEVGEDCERILGPGVEVVDVGRQDAGDGADVRLFVRYRLGGVERRSEGHGETVVAAHADLRRQLAIDRLRFGFSSLVDPS
jgi:hypothetical protein